LPNWARRTITSFSTTRRHRSWSSKRPTSISLGATKPWTICCGRSNTWAAGRSTTCRGKRVHNLSMAWFKKARKPIKATSKESRVPEGLWVKCPSCAKAIYNKDLVENLKVCDKCGHHFRMDCHERLAMLFDDPDFT